MLVIVVVRVMVQSLVTSHFMAAMQQNQLVVRSVYQVGAAISSVAVISVL
jgi:hypothetical protein